MEYLRELQQHILDYLAGKEDLDAVRTWLAPLVIEIGSCDDPQAKRVVYGMQRSISDFAEGFLLEAQLKQNFEALMFPAASLSSFQQISLGERPPVVLTGTSTLIEGREPAAFVGVGPALEYAS